MLNKEVKTRITNIREILVGKLPLPSDQIELATIGLIYKFMHDQDKENIEWGGEAVFFRNELENHNWEAIMSDTIGADERVALFENGIQLLATAEHIPDFFKSIFQNTFLKFKDGRIFKMFVDEINNFEYSHSEELGNAFEYLLMSMGTQAKNGQFRTPRNIIDFITEVVDPSKEDTILDPACGTAGFLISAYKHILRKNTPEYQDYRVTLNNYKVEGKSIEWGQNLSAQDKEKLSKNIVGYDNTPLMVRLSKVNMYLHQFQDPQIHAYDTLSLSSRWSETYSCILANPPFMTPKGGVEPHSDFKIRAKKAEVLFADYILEHLTPNGKAGFIVPEGIVFQNKGDYIELRKWAIFEGGLYAVVSLPAGVFQPYSGVKTSILLIDRALARNLNKVLFVKVENDGFSLGTNRDPIKANDLPEALRLLTDFRKNPDTYELGIGDKYKIEYNVVAKTKLAAIEEYNASSSARSFCEKSLARCEKAINTYELAKKEHPKFKKDIERFNEKLVKALKLFIKETTYPLDIEDLGSLEVIKTINLLPSKIVLKTWFKDNLKAATVAYGKSADYSEKEQLSKDLRKFLDRKRDYNLGFDSYIEIEKQNIIYPIFPLGEVCNIYNGSTPKKSISEYWEGGTIPWFTINDIRQQGRIIYDTTKNITELALKKTSVRLLKPNTVLICCTASVGEYAITKIQLTTNQQFNGLEIKEEYKSELLPEFLFYLSSKFKDYLLRKGGKTSFNFISIGKLKSILIPLPSLSEQQRIVIEVEQYQKVIDGCNLIIENYEPSFEIKEEWAIGKLGDIAEFSNGINYSKENKGKGLKVVSVSHFKNYFFLQTDKVQEINPIGITIKGKYLQENDIIFVRSNGNKNLIGRSLVCKGINCLMTHSGFTIRMRLKDKNVHPYFYAYLLKMPKYRKAMTKSGEGAGISNLSQRGLSRLDVPVPSFETQQKIVNELNQEQKTIAATKILKAKMEAKIKTIIDKVWGVGKSGDEDRSQVETVTELAVMM